jgi:Rps23 Pro-64 3,4-dihydroxylase Tpa1-like proline 4-hydroxylase
MRHSGDEIEKKGIMSANDPGLGRFGSLPLLHFIDRTLEAERKATEAEFRRCDAALAAQSQAEGLRHQAAEAKTQKANEVLDYRLAEMNNFREQINQERAEYLRREIYEREHSALAERVKNLEIVRGEQAGKTAAYASVVALAVIVVQVALHLWSHTNWK